MSYLVLVRHGESTWNKEGLWTGLKNVSLSQKGEEEAVLAGANIKNIKFNIGFTSVLKRAFDTIKIIKTVIDQNELPVIENKALNERDYGDFTGKNKWKIKAEVGDEEFLKIRRSWDYQIPNGESLKDVYDRVVPYFQNKILPYLKEGKNILVSAHGNSLRALIKYLENISDSQISNLEIATGEIYIYSIDQNGNVISKQVKNTSS